LNPKSQVDAEFLRGSLNYRQLKGNNTMTNQPKNVKGNISVGISDLKNLKYHISLCEKDDLDQFEYKGATLYVPYAKYLVEFLTDIQKEFQ